MSAAEKEYMVAADFTLYSNPINAALYQAPKMVAGKATSPPSPPEADITEEAAEMIASDMTKYDSPMNELEKFTRDRRAERDHRDQQAAEEDKRPSDHKASTGSLKTTADPVSKQSTSPAITKAKCTSVKPTK